MTTLNIQMSGVKLAEDSDEFLVPELASFLKKLEVKQGNVYLHVVALGAGESWGPNSRNDYFPEIALRGQAPEDKVMQHIKDKGLIHLLPKEWGISTFSTAHIFLHHKNNDAKYSVGSVLAVAYNEKMKRVECIIELNRDRCYAIADPDGKRFYDEAVDGRKLKFSMGCHVPFDRCSICQNLARNSGQYCGHIKGAALRPFIDGQRAYMINDFPVFFDLSIVTRPADASAWQLRKVADDDEDDDTMRAIIEHVKGLCCPVSETMRGFNDNNDESAALKGLANGIISHPLPDSIKSMTVHISIEKAAADIPRSLLLHRSLWSPLFTKTASDVKLTPADIAMIKIAVNHPLFGAAIPYTGMANSTYDRVRELRRLFQ